MKSSLPCRPSTSLIVTTPLPGFLQRPRRSGSACASERTAAAGGAARSGGSGRAGAAARSGATVVARGSSASVGAARPTGGFGAARAVPSVPDAPLTPPLPAGTTVTATARVAGITRGRVGLWFEVVEIGPDKLATRARERQRAEAHDQSVRSGCIKTDLVGGGRRRPATLARRALFHFRRSSRSRESGKRQRRHQRRPPQTRHCSP